jgi:hypothetical protein
MPRLLGTTSYSMNQASYDLARLRRNDLLHRVLGRNLYSPSPTTASASRSSTPKSTTVFSDPSSPATDPKPCPNSAPHYAPSTTTSTSSSPTPATRRHLKLKTNLKAPATKVRYADSETALRIG